MKKLKLLIVVLSLIVFIGLVNAGNMEINPNTVYIPIGGKNSTSVTIILNESDYIGHQHIITITFYNATINELTDKLNGTLTSNEVNVTLVDSESGTLYYIWTPTKARAYNFTLTIWFEKTATSNERFKVVVEDSRVTGEDIIVIASGEINAPPIPELMSIALVTIGIVLVVMNRRCGKL